MAPFPSVVRTSSYVSLPRGPSAFKQVVASPELPEPTPGDTVLPVLGAGMHAQSEAASKNERAEPQCMAQDSVSLCH